MCDTEHMQNRSTQPSVAHQVRNAVTSGGERFWKLADFDELPATAVAQSLSRLSRQGDLRRVRRGLYYRPRKTVFGPSQPSLPAIRAQAAKKVRFFPAGVTAANVLGLTTQVPARQELATTAINVSRQSLEPGTVVHTRRPPAWDSLTDEDAAVLDVLRSGGQGSELPPAQTTARLASLLKVRGRFLRLYRVSHVEPPRVRAMLGAFGQQLGRSRSELRHLASTLNALSRYEFGMFVELPDAAAWYAKLPTARRRP